MALLKIFVSEQSDNFKNRAANDGLKGRIITTIMLILTVVEYSQSQTTIRGLYPPVTELSKFKTVKTSSTCGLNNVPMRYCMSSMDNQTLTTCTQLNCLLDCCSTCGKTQPTSSNLLTGTRFQVTPSSIVRPGSTTGSQSSNFVSGSYITFPNLGASNVPQLGFSVCAWVRKLSSVPGTLISKRSSYALIIRQYDIDFVYTTRDAQTVIRNATMRNINLVENTWQHISFTVYNRKISLFLNGAIQRTIVLDGVINDVTTDARIGQRHDGSFQFVGLLQELKYFARGLTNREVIEAMNGTLPSIYGQNQCRCSPSHPRISPSNPLYCIENGIDSSSSSQSRLSPDSHPPEYLVDGDVVKPWISQLVENATVEIDLVYKELQVFQVQIMFYSPPAKGIKIERSLDGGQTYLPWQYFANDCTLMFGLPNNGPLTQPDSVNCLQITSPVRTDFETLSFQTQEPGPESKPQRPVGESGCSDFHCSPKLLEFVKATNVKISFYQHMLVTNALHKYFGVRRILVSGTCDCYGHGSVCTTFESNSTHNASYVCTCDPRTFTQGTQCQECLPLYRDKPFKRGMVLNAYPCKKCECNNHATSCTYSKSLDSNPNDRTVLGGGVCDNCQHNTIGRFCETCKPLFFRPSGKAANAVDACSPCNCVGNGVVAQNSDCQRDDSNTSIIAGQCPCKRFTTGRQCDRCKDGYYYLTAGNPEGCISCECNTAGIQNGNLSCGVVNGQCSCKANVYGLKCSRCKPGFYGLSSSNVQGCSPCNCDPWGSTNAICNENTGQCPCKSTTVGLRCHQCRDGYHSLVASGCQQCRCNVDGTDPARLSLCDKTTGNCACRRNVEGRFCDRCKAGFYNLSRTVTDGCLACNCDSKGTIGNVGACNSLNGTCSCKPLVSGRQCNSCKVGTFNLSADNSDGCTRCNCFANGTVGGDTTLQASLPCFTTGQCSCLANVGGLKCDRCSNGYYWNPSGRGCVQCNCNIQGSVDQSCNSTGYCNCRPGSGVGGRRCDQCLSGYYNYNNGRCTSCGCSVAGSVVPNCDATGICLQCKPNVQGTKCDQCKPGTSNLRASNPFGCSGPPSEQGPPVISNITSRSLVASWFPPDTPNGLILRYELFRNTSLVYNGTNRVFVDTGLVPYTLYGYQITVYTDGGSTRSVDSDKVYRTLQDVPAGMRPPQISNVQARSIDLRWQPPIYPNGIIIAFRLTSTSIRSSSPIQHYNGQELRTLVVGLRPFTVYNFTVVACNIIGCEQSNVTTQATRSAAPDSQPAPYMRSLEGGRSVFVYWDPPAEPNGVIQFYDLFIRQSPFNTAGATTATKLNPTQRNYTVTGLQPFTEYEFRVVSYTSQVKGDTSSSWSRIRTQESVPSGHEYISPRSQHTFSTAVNITWSEPRFPNGFITRYEIYRYEQADLSRPILSNSTSGTSRHSLITNLAPYSSYQISVRACNSKGCTGYSSRISIRTLPDAPRNQGAPNVTSPNGSSVSLTWSAPALLNGPLPVKYEIMRSFVALHQPPLQVEQGMRFPAYGYYRLPASLIPDSAETRLEFNVKTRFPDGIIFYAASDLQEDILAVELRAGKPWFIFDTETGPAAFSVSGSVRIDDGSWHTVLVTRTRRNGAISVDGGRYTGSGTGGGSANIVGQISSVYIGGLPPSFRILRSDTGNTILRRKYFIGCLRNMKYKNNNIDFHQALQSSSVGHLYSHCPSDIRPGIHFKGSGYIALPSGNFTGGNLFVIQMLLRTTYESGLLLFAHGTGTTSIAILTQQGNITLFYRTPTRTGIESARFPQLCDGNWHNVTLTGFASFSTFNLDNVVYSFGSIPADAILNSKVYIGGVPQGSQAETLLKSLTKTGNISFGGCMRDVAFARKLDVQRDIVESRNVLFDGCPPETASVSTTLTCRDPVRSVVQRPLSTSVVDHGLLPFTDYLYSVRSYRDGISGYASSEWVSITTNEGAPSGIAVPVASSYQARWVEVSWSRPSVSGGLLTKYQVRAADASNASIIISADSDTSLLRHNLTGLEPYTAYIVSIVAFTSGGSGASSYLAFTTREALPEQLGPPTAIAYPRSLFIMWKPPRKPNGIILLYRLQVNGLNVSRFANQPFNYTATGLQVYTGYTVVLQAMNAIGIATSEATIYTGQLPPQGVHAPQLRVLGSRRIEVTWRRPDILNGVISSYEVLTATVDNETMYITAFSASSEIFTTVIANMTPGQLYYFRIGASTAGGRTIGNLSIARTLESSPEDVLPPVCTPVSPYVINVNIRVPLKPNGVIIYYVLYQDDVVAKNDSQLFFQSTGFQPYTRHTYRTRACTAKGCGESITVSVYTLDAQPIGNVTLYANVTGPRSMSTRWNAVQIPNGIISYAILVTGEYYINVSSSGNPLSFETRNMTRTVYNGSLANAVFQYNGLLPFSYYEVQVNASNRAGYVLSNVIALSTPPDAPDGVYIPVIRAINSTALNVSWRQPHRPNGIITSYQLIGRFPSGSSSHFQISYQPGMHFFKILGNLEPYTRYSFKVAVNGSGGRSESAWQNITTPQDVPEHVDQPKILNIESRTIFVELSAPAKPNGIIIHYVLYLNDTEVNRTLQTRFQARGLLPFSFYVAYVDCCTVVGCRSSVRTKIFQTLQDVPAGLSAPTLRANGSRSVIVTWTKPLTTNGIILMYQIQRRLRGEVTTFVVGNVNATISPNIFEDRTVKPWRRYEFRVIAQTVAGGTPSPYNSILMPEGDPEGLLAPNVTILSSTSLLVLWQPPSYPNGHVIHYYVNTAGRQELINRTTDLSITLSGLGSYIEYPVTVRACTIGGCGESPATTARTLPSMPREQPAPTATMVSSTSLRVRWDLPVYPNGPIVQFYLSRSTIEDIVSGSPGSVFPTNWTLVFQGSRQTYDDIGLGIYSVQQYMVTAVTTIGNTTSNTSMAFRLGAAPPLQGVNLIATVIDHASVNLSWTLPPLRMLRGPAIRFDISYEIVGGPVFVAGSLQGNQTRTSIGNLRPRTRYAFKVSVFNGAGARDSAKVEAETLDGSPEGFDAPTLYVVSSSSIRVTWTAPRIPNGVIVNYTVYGNSQGYDTVSAITRSHVQGNLKAYTEYSVQVRACTLYACTLSSGRTVRTLSAPPGLIHPPSLQPLSSTAIRVLWAPPVEPNGLMVGYRLYRRKVYNCPTTPKPAVKCTYVECSIAEQICNGRCYSPSRQICCNGTLHLLESTKSCCGQNYIRRNSPTDVCCGGAFHMQQNGYQCCHGNYMNIPSGSVCCRGSTGVVVGIGNTCCGDVPYDINGDKSCVCGALYDRYPFLRKCCGGKVISAAEHCCGNDTVGKKYAFNATKTCCGTSYVDVNSSLCCLNSIGQFRVHTHISSTQKSQMQCCGLNQILNTSSCCNNQSYDAATQICADRSSFGQTDCGTGLSCRRDQSASAYCNRCDFDTARSVCGSVSGYFDTSSNLTSNATTLCFTNYTEILGNPSNPNLFSFDDKGLLPHTRYGYYVNGINTEGLSRSLPNSTRTLMAKPEGLLAPRTTRLSATRITITWSAPSRPNGVIQAYKLYRIKWETKQERMVFSGLSFSHTDSEGLEPYTGYMYILSACTVLCSNKSAEGLVYTDQAAPQNVLAPVLTPISSSIIQVNWTAPTNPNGIIVRYNVSKLFNGTNASILPQNDFGLGLSQRVTGLIPYTLYSFKVIACTSAGCSAGPASSVRTLQAPPQGLSQPTITVVDAKTVDVDWRRPLVLNGVLLRYVLYRNASKIYQGSLLTFRDTNLTPNLFYSYRVEAVTGGGGSNSSVAAVKLPESTPEGIATPTLTPITYSQLRVSWQRPSRPNGIITSYELIYNEPGSDQRTILVQLATTYTIGSLKAYTQYEVRVRACTVKGCGTGNRAIARTLEAAPTGQLPPTLIARSSSIIDIRWRTPTSPNGIITRYEITRKEMNAVMTFVVYIGTSLEYIDTGLRPYTQYQYKVKSRNSAGTAESTWANARTASGIPQGLSAPVVLVVDGVSVQVTWQPPTNPNGLITGYEIKARMLSQASSEFVARCCISPSNRNVTVTGLRPATTYEFRVAAKTSAGSGLSPWTSARTKEDRPANISELSSNKNPDGSGNGKSLQVFWNPPLNPNGVITNYILYLVNDIVYQGLHHQTIIRRLQPFTNYTFRLEVCNSAGCTKGDPQILITAEVTPSGQIPPSVGTVTATSVTLRWKPPISPNGFILRYDVLRRTGSATRRKRQTLETIVYSTNDTNKAEFSYTDSSLAPFSTYQYKIRAVNLKGQTDSDWVTITTVASPPSGVSPPNATALNGFSVRLQWLIPRIPNGEIKYYDIFRNGIRVHTLSERVYTDINLSPVTLYKYSIRACTVAGCTMSRNVTVTTLAAAPGDMRPPTLIPIDANRIRATWTAPAVPNGQIQKYQLRLANNEQPVFEGLSNSYIVSGLSPYTLYSLTITACTVSGCGSRSNVATARTSEAPPQDLDAPSLFVLGPTTIEATWSRPRTPNGVIRYYTLRRGTNVVYNGTDLRFIDRTVAPGTRYQYTVSCTNGAGSVTSNAQISDTTTPSAPENVSSPSLRPLTSTSIEVSWTVPEKPNGAIVKYYVLVSGREIDVGNRLSYVVLSLGYYTLYSFRISACTAAGCATGPSASARTLEATPGNQSAPIFHSGNIGSRYIVAEWLPPRNPNGVIRTYELRRRSSGIAEKTVYTGPLLVYNDSSSDIEPSTSYEYQVTVSNGAGSVSSRWAPVMTAIDKPEQVKAVTVLPQDIKSDSFVFTIEEPGKPNGKIMSYIVELVGVRNITLNTVKRGIAIDLNAHTEYSIRMYACNSAGCTKGPTSIVRTAAAPPTGFNNAPTIVSKTSRSVSLRWIPPTKLNGPFIWYKVSQRYTCPQNSIPPQLCYPGSQVFNATNRTEFSVPGLHPYVRYHFKVTVYNNAGSTATPETTVITNAESPVVLLPPNVTVVGNTITIEWTRSFDLRSPLEEYSLEENRIEAYTGNKLVVVRPNREVGAYRYIVTAKTLVNGRTISISTSTVTVNVGDVAPTAGTAVSSDAWYQKVWVLALLGLAAALVLLLLVVLMLRRFSGDLQVFVRERDPLPIRPKSTMGSQTGSRSSLDAISEKRFPYLGTPSPSRKEAYQMTPNLYSSRQQLIETSLGNDFTPTSDKLSFLDPTEPSWDNYLKGFSSNGKDRDSGLFDDPSPTLQDEEDSMQYQSVQKERILFPDTHL